MADPENGAIATDTSEEPMEESEDRKEIVQKLMKDPQILAALQTKLNRYLGTPSGYIESLPKCVTRRIKALKNLQLKFTEIEANFFKEIHDLEVKYDKLHSELYDQRNKIVNALYEPNDEECNFTVYDTDEDEEEEEKEKEEKLSKNLEDKANIDETSEKEEKKILDENTKGIPEFWLTIFKNVDLLMDMVQEHDEPILAQLQDIQLKFHNNPMGFTLEFHFPENEYFSNSVLTKYYEMKCEPDTDDPFGFEGPEIIRCKGCSIDWKKGKNITQKTIKKKQKHKSRGSTRTITKTVQNDSFFNFFNPPEVPDDTDDEMDEESQALLTADFEIGHYIRERIVPRAVLYFTGEALDDKDFEEDEEEEEEDGDDEDDEDLSDEDSDKDPDFDPEKAKAKALAAGAQQPPECKQQ